MSLADVFVRVRPKVDADRAELDAEGHRIGTVAGNAAGRGFADEFNDKVRTEVATRLVTSFAAAAGRFTLMGAAAAAATPQVLGLASVLAQTSGVAVAAPAALLGAAAAGGVLAIAFHGMKDAVAAVISGNPQAIADTFAKISPEARKTALAVGQVTPQFRALFQSIQDTVLRGFADQVRALATAWLPALRTGLGQVAVAVHTFGVNLAGAARNGTLMRGVSDVMAGTAVAVGRAAGGVGNLAHAFGLLLSTGAPVLARLGTGFTALAQRFDAFIGHAAQTGQLTRWLNDAIRVLGDLGRIVVNVGSILGSVLGAANGYGGRFLDTLVKLTGQAADWLRSTQGMDTMRTILRGLSGAGGVFFDLLKLLFPIIVQVAGALQPLLPLVSDLVTAIGHGLGDVISALLPPLKSFIGDLVTSLRPILPVITGMFKTLAPIIGQVATILVQNLGPILPVIAGLIRDLAPVVTQLASTLGQFLVAALKALLPPITDLVKALAKDLRPLWPEITKAIKDLTPSIVKCIDTFGQFGGIFIKLIIPLIPLVVKAILLLVPPLVDVMKWILRVTPLFAEMIIWVVDHLAPAFMWFWHNVVEPVWHGIHAAISFAWDNVIKPVFNGIKWFVETVLAPVFVWLWHNVVEPVWHGIKDTITGVWDHGIKPVLDAMVGFITRDVPNAWRAGANAVGTAWSRVQDLAAAPVRWIIDHVINGGIIRVWNAVAGVFPGAPHLDPIDMGVAAPPVFHGLSTGGVLPGYEPGRDTVPAMLSRGEAVLRPEVTRQLGADTINEWNQAARMGRPVAGFADGGIVGDILGIFTGPAKWLTGKVGGAVGSIIARFGDHPWTQLLTAVPKKIISVVADWVTHALASFGGGGAPRVAPAFGTAGAAQAFARAVMGSFGFGPDQWLPLLYLWTQESGWNPYAVNPSSGAYGIPQALGHGHPYALGDYANQIMWGLDYIRGRYGSPAAAWGHEMAFNWYDQGGPLMPGYTLAYNGTGKPETVTTADTMRDVLAELRALRAQHDALIAAVRADRHTTVKVGERDLAHAVTAAQRRVEWEG